MAAITRFPMSHWKMIWNRRGPRAVNCVVSDRWLRFGDLGRPAAGYVPSGDITTPVPLDVLTGGYDGEPRKICSLLVSYEELKSVVDRLTAEMANRADPA